VIAVAIKGVSGVGVDPFVFGELGDHGCGCG
jgi:hypothetical protein